jgi:ATPase subunit of ABC transporter with duplicated ATPase domains
MESPRLEVSGLCIDTPAGRPLFRDLGLSIGAEHVAAVGRNGVGKSTLLEVLAGHEEVRQGSLQCRGSRRLVRQELGAEARDPGSPGERRRRALSAAFDAQPDLLLLDEPTQDLDAEGVSWLRARIEQWEGGLIVVSHDRSLLRGFRDFFVVAEAGCRHFAGSFDALMRDLEEERSQAQRSYVRHLNRLVAQEKHNTAVAGRRQRKKNLGRIHEVGRSGPRILLNTNRSYAQESQGKRSVLQKRRIEAARQWAKATRRALSVDLPLEVMVPAVPAEPGPPIVRLECVSACAGGRTLFEGVDLELSCGDRVAITGPNGAGKTTLLEILRRERQQASGRARADGVRMGCIAQNVTNWMADESLIMLLGGESAAGPEAIAQRLVAHRFPLALAERPLASLSPGERVRAALICLFQRRPVLELLVLDEPTDHLDFVGLAAVQDALRAWRGGLCVVSHDEEFLSAIGVERRIVLGG